MPSYAENHYRVDVREPDGSWVMWCANHTLGDAQSCLENIAIDFEVSAAKIVDDDTGEVIDQFDLDTSGPE